MPVSFELSDATGNLFDAGDYANPNRDGSRTSFLYFQNLFRGETTWRVRTELARTRSALFSAVEKHTFRGLPVPRRDHPVPQPLAPAAPMTGVVNGVPVKVEGIAWGSRGPPYANLVLSLERIPLRGHRITLLTVMDDQERRVPIPDREPDHTEFEWTDPPMIRVELPFEVRKPMKSVDATIAVQKTRFVEFLASPTRPRPWKRR